MQRLILLLVCVFLTACQYFEKQKMQANTIAEKTLNTIDWNAIDTYPRFSNCDSMITKAEGKTCFENTIQTTIQSYLIKQIDTLSVTLHSTILIQLRVSKKGKISIDSLRINEDIVLQIPKMDSFVRQSIKQLPELYPAIKRGELVASQFLLPIEISEKKFD